MTTLYDFYEGKFFQTQPLKSRLSDQFSSSTWDFKHRSQNSDILKGTVSSTDSDFRP